MAIYKAFLGTITAICTMVSMWFASTARSSILSYLERSIQQGYLEIHDGKNVFKIGRHTDSTNSVFLKVLSDSFWLRVFLSGDLGFSEAYMMGEVDVKDDNLEGVMNLWLENESTMVGLSSVFGRIASVLSSWANAFLGQRLSRARLNAMSSYDQSNELFKAFLSKEMMYSCALWDDAEGRSSKDTDSASLLNSRSSSTETLAGKFTEEIKAVDTLEKSQSRKIDHVLRALRLQPGMRLLEFGSGWGGLAIAAAQQYGVEVDTLTLSVEQKRLAEERISLAGLDGRVRVHLMDYRLVPDEWSGSFDAFVSIEMLEHVGTRYYDTYFGIVDRMLKDIDSVAVVTSSTFPESRYSTYQAEDFMRRYMWPNSCLPSATALIMAAHRASGGRFTLERVENHGSHYSRTLQEWGRRLEANLTPAILGLDAAPSNGLAKLSVEEKKAVECTSYDQAPSEVQVTGTLLQHLPSDSLVDPLLSFQAIKRKWQYLFAYAGAGFQKGYLTCHMLTFAKGFSEFNS